jgi:alkylmercury lyase-like protein
MDADQALDTAVRLEVYRWFIDQGRPPVPAEVADTLATDQASVEDSLRRLAEAHVLVLAPGTHYVWMANPLSAIPTPFQVKIGGRRFFGNCIWDALGVVAMLGGTGTVTTWCPDCDQRMSITIAENRLASGDGMVHFATSAAHWWDDIGFT